MSFVHHQHTTTRGDGFVVGASRCGEPLERRFNKLLHQDRFMSAQSRSPFKGETGAAG